MKAFSIFKIYTYRRENSLWSIFTCITRLARMRPEINDDSRYFICMIRNKITDVERDVNNYQINGTTKRQIKNYTFLTEFKIQRNRGSNTDLPPPYMVLLRESRNQELRFELQKRSSKPFLSFSKEMKY